MLSNTAQRAKARTGGGEAKIGSRGRRCNGQEQPAGKDESVKGVSQSPGAEEGGEVGRNVRWKRKITEMKKKRWSRRKREGKIKEIRKNRYEKVKKKEGI